MSLIGTLQEMRRYLNENKIDKEQFIAKLDKMVEKARVLTMLVHDQQEYNDVVELIAFYVANGDMELAEMIRSLITEYLSLSKGLNEEEYKKFKEMVLFYLQK
jgi:hypothetical protein